MFLKVDRVEDQHAGCRKVTGTKAQRDEEPAWRAVQAGPRVSPELIRIADAKPEPVRELAVVIIPDLAAIVRAARLEELPALAARCRGRTAWRTEAAESSTEWERPRARRAALACNESLTGRLRVTTLDYRSLQ